MKLKLHVLGLGKVGKDKKPHLKAVNRGGHSVFRLGSVFSVFNFYKLRTEYRTEIFRFGFLFRFFNGPNCCTAGGWLLLSAVAAGGWLLLCCCRGCCAAVAAAAASLVVDGSWRLAALLKTRVVGAEEWLE